MIAVVPVREPGAPGPPGLRAEVLDQTVVWFERVSQRRSDLEFQVLAPVAVPSPFGYYAPAGGKGPWPNNSQRLAADVARALPDDDLETLRRADGRLLIVASRQFLPHTWHVPRDGVPADRMWIRRFAIVPPSVKFGALAHEIGHLAFDWPDLRWPQEAELECLMAKGATLAGGNDPAPPSAPLLVRAGWRTPVRVARNLTVRGLARRGVGTIDWHGKQLLAEVRPGRLLLYTTDTLPEVVARVAVGAPDERKAVVGLLAPRLRRLPVPTGGGPS